MPKVLYGGVLWEAMRCPKCERKVPLKFWDKYNKTCKSCRKKSRNGTQYHSKFSERW